tara:strand:+ start:52 stop:843 length:792 start_codon:yes stop_codon:yes gene_type:complete
MKNDDTNDFDLVRLSQTIHKVINRRKKLVFLIFIGVFSIGVYNYFMKKEMKNSYYLIKCNTHFFQNDNNDLKTIGLELCYNLSNYVTNKNYDNLSTLIGVDQEKIKIIENIKVVNIDDNNNNNYFRLYFFFEGMDSTLQIVESIIETMNNQPFLIKQRALNELYYSNYIEELNKQIEKLSYDSTTTVTEKELPELLYQKNELKIKSEMNDPFYLLNGENNIAIKNNYILDLFKYLFYFLFISFTIVIATEAFVFLKKNKISSN